MRREFLADLNLGQHRPKSTRQGPAAACVTENSACGPGTGSSQLTNRYAEQRKRQSYVHYFDNILASNIDSLTRKPTIGQPLLVNNRDDCFAAPRKWLAISAFSVIITAATIAPARMAAAAAELPAVNAPYTTPPAVRSAEPIPALDQTFQRQEGWTGADGAYSIQLDPSRTLWTFADTWIGKIVDGKRVEAKMINNTAAIQKLDDREAPWQFFWRGDRQKPCSLWGPDRPGTWFWPGDGAMVDGKLYMFMHRIRRKPAKEPDFGFTEGGNVLMQIGNPLEEPEDWRIHSAPLPYDKDDIQFGNACLLDGDYLYVYCSFAKAQQGMNKHPLMLARITKKKLQGMEMNGWQYLCRDDTRNSQEWQRKPIKPIILFPDAAPEMTVSRIRGIEGLIATYCPSGFGADIVIRRASSPEGPWGEPVPVYHCPENLDKTYIYAAKAHPELATKDGELIFTYCRNTKFFADQLKTPDVYAPRAVLVKLKN